MEQPRDKMLHRFRAFWLGISVFLLFAVIFVFLNYGNFLFVKKRVADQEETAAGPRYKTKEEVNKAQVTELSPEQIKKVMPQVASTLLTSRPTAVEKPEQVVPESPTAKKLAAAPPAVEVNAVTPPVADADAPILPEVMELGKTQFAVCAACHGANGEGSAAGPPLANSEWVTGPVSNLVKIQMRGLTGPLKVAGKDYDFPSGMFPQTFQTDEQIAAVLTYVRNSFGNKASAVKVEHVTPLRSEVGKPQLKTEELVKP